MTTIAQTIVAEVRNRLFAGTLSAGDRLEETDLASEFNVSRMPVRDALIVLEEQGLIKRTSRSGSLIYAPDMSDYHMILETLVALEGQAAGLAARRISIDQGRALEEATKACEGFSQT